MSEALGTDDIEDVLSSVRRLVSPEARPRVVSRDLRLDTLVLTPSLQVAVEAPRVEPLILTERAVELEDTTVALVADLVPEPVVTEPAVLEAAVPEADPVAVMDEAEASLAAPEEASAPVDPAVSTVTDTDLHVMEGEWEDAFWSEPEPALAEIALGAEEAEVVAADPAPWAQEETTSPAPKPAAEAPRSPLVEGLEGLTDADGNPVTVLDEDALNEIVRALIREELQGVLGERITQNVRKLVRAEINRALTARSLD